MVKSKVELIELTHEISDFLLNEAELLDDRKYIEWLNLLTDDVTYEMPIRTNRELGQDDEISYENEHFSENKTTLEMRAKRLGSVFAWAENPPSRTRHFVTNIRINPINENEVEVKSYILLYRSRGVTTDIELISGKRRDVVRNIDGGWKLAKRMIIVDEATVGANNLAVFL